MRLLRNCLRPVWQKLVKLYAIRGKVGYGEDLHLGIGSKLFAARSLTIGRDVYIGKFCTIECDRRIGDDVLIGNAVGSVGRHDHDFTAVGVPIRRTRWIVGPSYCGGRKRNEVIISSDAWIGYGAIVLSGVTVGRGANVAAGAAVREDVLPYTIVAGNPALQIGVRFSEAVASQHEALLTTRAAVTSRTRKACGTVGVAGP